MPKTNDLPELPLTVQQIAFSKVLGDALAHLWISEQGHSASTSIPSDAAADARSSDRNSQC
jgi:hypothetical protein